MELGIASATVCDFINASCLLCLNWDGWFLCVNNSSGLGSDCPIPSSHMTSILYIFYLLGGLSIQFLTFILDVDYCRESGFNYGFCHEFVNLGLG